MQYFWSDGGSNRPSFTYRFLMRRITDDMYYWCEAYPLDGPFERWHIIHNYYEGTALRDDAPETPLIQFESRKAAYMFRLAFSEYIIADKTYEFAKDKDWI